MVVFFCPSSLGTAFFPPFLDPEAQHCHHSLTFSQSINLFPVLGGKALLFWDKKLLSVIQAFERPGARNGPGFDPSWVLPKTDIVLAGKPEEQQGLPME